MKGNVTIDNQKVRDLMDAHRMTIPELTRKAGITDNTARKMVYGKADDGARYSQSTLKKAAVALGVLPSYIGKYVYQQ